MPPLRKIQPNGIVVQYLFDDLNRLSHATFAAGSSGLAQDDWIIRYQYDANGNRTQQIEANGRGDEQTDYDFDANDRLLSISYPNVPSGEGNDVTYQN